MKKKAEKRTRIWAIGSGKGGVGKTLIISQVAKSLAEFGKRVILIDCDFSSPNIHSLFRIQPTDRAILDYFQADQAIENLIQQTKVKNLEVIIGKLDTASCMNISQKLIRHFFSSLKKMNTDFILLDLGSGSSQVVIDIFLEADEKIVVTDLEIISIENMFHFIRHAFFRKLNISLSQHGLHKTVENLWKNRKQFQIKTMGDLIRQLGEVTEKVDLPTLKKLTRFPINLINNKVRKANDIIEGFSIKSICTKYFGVEALYSGYVEYDNQLWKNFSLVPFNKFTISPRIEQEILTIAENINTGNQIKIDRVKNV